MVLDMKRVMTYTTIYWDCPNCDEQNEMDIVDSKLENGKYIATCCCWNCNKETEVEKYDY